MKVGFADTFWDSLKTISRHNTWWYKTYDFFRRDIWRFIKNVWRFRKALANHYWWDHHGTLMFMETSFTHMAENLEKHGMEIDISRLKKVTAMKRAAQIIKNYNESNFIEMAEAELGEIVHHPWEFEDVPDKPGYSQLIDKDTPAEKKHNRKVYDRARQIEEQEWKELMHLLQGQNHKDYKKFEKTLTEDQKRSRDQYYEWFDGSGLKGWWD